MRQATAKKSDVLLWAYCVVSLLPLWWLLVTALKPLGLPTESLPGALLPTAITWEHFQKVVAAEGFMRAFLNSVLVSTTTAVLNVASSTLLAFALHRQLLPCQGLWMTLILLVTAAPFQVIMIPLYLWVSTLGLTDRPESPVPVWLGLILPYAISGFGILFLKSAFEQIPRSIFDAATLDGCNQWQTLCRVALRPITPSLITLFVISLIGNWGEFLWPNLLIVEPTHLTLPLALARLQQAFTDNWRLIAAGAIISLTPTMMLFVWLQRYIVPTQNAEGEKG